MQSCLLQPIFLFLRLVLLPFLGLLLHHLLFSPSDSVFLLRHLLFLFLLLSSVLLLFIFSLSFPLLFFLFFLSSYSSTSFSSPPFPLLYLPLLHSVSFPSPPLLPPPQVLQIFMERPEMENIASLPPKLLHHPPPRFLIFLSCILSLFHHLFPSPLLPLQSRRRIKSPFP